MKNNCAPICPIIFLRLTPSPVPSSLHRVHLVVRVSGRVFRKTFEADSSLSFIYAWDKRNVYNQKVYGVVEARVSVGYQVRRNSCHLNFD
jgi:hypothetical protein